MALDRNQLRLTSQDGVTGPNTWIYDTTDTLATVNTSGYFNDASDILTVNDLITVVSETGGTAAHTLVVVNANASGVVDVSDGVDIGKGQVVQVSGKISDISTAGQTYLRAPIAGTVTSVVTKLNGAIATADATITVKDDAGSSMGTITVANSGSAAGDEDSLAPSSNNTVAAGEHIEVETDGSSTNTIELDIAVVITPTDIDAD